MRDGRSLQILWGHLEWHSFTEATLFLCVFASSNPSAQYAISLPPALRCLDCAVFEQKRWSKSGRCEQQDLTLVSSIHVPSGHPNKQHCRPSQRNGNCDFFGSRDWTEKKKDTISQCQKSSFYRSTWPICSLVEFKILSS